VVTCGTKHLNYFKIIFISHVNHGIRGTLLFSGCVWCCTGGGFPNAKLAALQKVLSSDFFSAVREVYEHVYETVELSGSVEVRANATAKVPRPLAFVRFDF